MKAYISVSFSKRKILNQEINTIMRVLKKHDMVPFVFVDEYKFDSAQEQEMMIAATRDLDNCTILIAEVSDKGIGIGVEVGYAKAKGKPVVYLRNEKAEHSTTVSGISDFHVVYSDVVDLANKLTMVLTKLP